MFRRILPILLLTGAAHAAQPNLPAEVTVARVTPTTIALRWHSDTNQPGSVDVRQGEKTRTVPAASTGSDYHAILRDLAPNSEVRFTLHPYGKEAASREHVAYTTPPKGTLETETLPVLAVVYAPIHFTDAPTNGPIPADAQRTVSEDDLNLIRKQLSDVRDFYFHSTHGKLNLVWDVVSEDTDIGNRPSLDAGDVDPFFERTVDRVLADRKKTPADYAGAVFMFGWGEGLSPEAKAKVYRGQAFSGGTYGTDGPWKFKRMPYTMINFNHRADIRWTVTHEFGHQLDSMAEYSGYPSLAFNHPDPVTDVGAFGEHWDANRWLLSKFPRDYWTNLVFGTRRLSPDADSDGLADNDPFLPTDEKRFGSDARKADTDGDGLSDLDEYTATMGVYQGLNEQMAGPILKPDPRNPDTDGDGLKDGIDPYPQYAVSTVRRYDTPVFDGAWTPNEWQDAGGISTTVDGRRVEARFGLQWDDQYLYVGMRADRPLDLSVDLDADNDGWFAGSDNYRLMVSAPSGGAEPAVSSVVWDWSVFDPTKDPNPYLSQTKDLVKASDIVTATGTLGGAYVIEVAIPMNYRTSLRLYDGKRLGVKLAARVPGAKDLLTEFEPQTLMTMELKREY